jgi:hypothetical protein
MENQFKPIIEYKYGLTELEEFEMKYKGYRNNVIVAFASTSSKFELCFYDTDRLSQDIENEKIIYEPGLVILNEVTKENIEKAIMQMWEDGFFDRLRPMP